MTPVNESKRRNLQFPVDLVTFTAEIVNGKLHFLCSEGSEYTSGSECDRVLNITRF